MSSRSRKPKRNLHCRLSISLLAVATALPSLHSQTMKAGNIQQEPTLYVVPYAHLDTQWRWEFPQSISEYLYKTLRVNFDYIDRYPHYVFNWTGANRYRLMKEYFPADYARMKQYVADGRWFPAGSSVEEGDVNLPTAEGIFRQILYGNDYFRKEFGKASNEYMLPDCFGFPASLPSILAHAGVKGFSTQKLSAAWQPAAKVGGPHSPEQTPEGIPFNVGVWVGPDGKTVLAALDPGGYGSNVYTDLSQVPAPPPPVPQLTDEQKAKLTTQQRNVLNRGRTPEVDWVKRLDIDGKATGVFADYKYVGTGDIGGATQESTVKVLEATVTRSSTVLPPYPVPNFLRDMVPATSPGGEVRIGEGPVHVVEAAANQMFDDITPNMTSRMPRYTGDLELINHSAGSLTSQAYHKRWILQNENLADAAEKASLAAAWMGGRTYPQARINDAWMLELSGHFHDSGAGTATPRAYQFTWNDDIIAANQFADVLTSATTAVASGLATLGKGIPIVVYNPLNIDREDLVEAAVTFAGTTPSAARVIGPDGKETPAQVENGKVLFSAKTPSVGFAVFDVLPAKQASRSELKVTESSLENARYHVQLNRDGDVSSILDKTLNKELLSAPIRLAISNDAPAQYPAWNMDFDQEQAPPRAYVGGTARVRITERGPVRVALEVTREAEHSKFVQTIRLAAGDAGNRVEIANSIDWQTPSANLKASIPLSAANPNATYNWDVGTIERPNANERQFEVASHRWIDLTDKSGSFGTTILTDFKNGSDKPNDNTIRLTLLRSPGIRPPANGGTSGYTDQANQDWGHHEFVFGLAGHEGDWRQGQTDWQANRLNDPLIAFETSRHSGALGKSFSLLKVSNPRVRVLALKKAENSDEVVLRMVELDGKSAPDVRVSFAAPITAVREINAQEQGLETGGGSPILNDGALLTSFDAYQPRTFALQLSTPSVRLDPPRSQTVPLQYDLATASNDDTKTPGGGMDGKGNALPAEMLPAQIKWDDVEFALAPAATGTNNAVTARGQSIPLPAGDYNRVLLLASAADQDQKTVFHAGEKATELNIEYWGGFIGQWDNRVWKNRPQENWAISAGHAPWPPPNMEQREARIPSPRYPDDYAGLETGFVKPASLAWYVSHHHTAEGLNEPYQYSYLFAYTLDLPAGAHSLTLPNNDKIRIFAISVAHEEPSLKAAAPLYDTLQRTEPPASMETAGR